MKVIKTIFIAILTVVFLAVLAVFLFLKMFDVNKFLPQITQQVSQAVGREVRAGHVELGFSLARGLALQVRDVTVAEDTAFSEKPFFTVKQIDAGVDVKALFLERRIRVASIVVVSPEISIMRSAEGQINAASLGPRRPAVAGTGGVTTSQGSAAALPAFLVSDIRITDARILYTDRMFTPPIMLQVDRIDVHVADFSLTAPFMVTVKAAIFAAQQNINVTFQLTPDMAAAGGRLQGMDLKVDLAPFDVGRMEREMPLLQPLSLKRLGGIFRLTIADMTIGAQAPLHFKGQADVLDGLLVTGLLPLPLESVRIEAGVDEKQLDVKALTFAVAEGAVNGTGRVSDYLSVPQIKVLVAAQGINVKKISEAYKAPVTVNGRLDGVVDLGFTGNAPEAILSSMNGEVGGELKDGLLENINLVALGLENIPMLPGLLERIMTDLSPETQAEIRKGQTRLESCVIKAHMANGAMTLDTARMITRDLEAQATGGMTLKQDLDLKAEVRMEKQVSQRLGQRVRELVYLQDEDGRIYLPMKITGPVMRPVCMPDLQYLTGKLIAAAGGEQLQKVFEGNPAAVEAVGAIFDLFKKK